MKNKIRKMFAVFDRSQQKKLLYLTIIILMDAFVELLGISIIIPFIDAILQPEKLMNEWYIKILVRSFGLTMSNLIIVLCIMIICIYVLKNLFLIYMTNLQYRFSYYGKRDLSNRFMKCYLLQDYSFHLKHNSAEMIRDISNDTDMFYITVLNFLQLISECVVCIILVLYLMATDFLITIGVACSLGVMVLFFMGSYKKTLVNLGNQRRIYAYKMQQAMQQGFGGIKEIKIANRENFFLREYENACSKNAEANRKNLFLNAIPKPVMEILCISGLMIVICIRICLGTSTESFVSVLGVFAVAAFRLLPSVNKISGYIGNILHNGVVIDVVYENVKKIEELEGKKEKNKKVKEVILKNEISIDRLSFRYPEMDNMVLENADIKIGKNTSVAFIGPSGAGKTTMVDIILGLLNPSEGNVKVDGVNIQNDILGWRKQIGYIPQNIYMLDDTIRNNIVFGEKNEKQNEERVWSVLEEAQLKEFVEELPQGLETMIGEAGVRISGGQRQRIGIARALYTNPSVLVLDEATSALDNETESAVMESIEHLQGKMTMIIIAHRLTTIKNCDKIYEIKDRKVREIKGCS